jgi:hypothetical protein
VFEIAKTAHGYASTPTTLVSFNGTDGAVHSNVHDGIIDHANSEFTQFAELLSQSHQDAANLAHDAADPVHHAAMLSAQHVQHFLV